MSTTQQTGERRKILLSWSSGKDSAWALHVLRQQPDVDVVGLLTTINAAFERVAMHAVRVALLRAQVEAVGLPLVEVQIPYPCSDPEYAAVMQEALTSAAAQGVTAVAFGDLFLEDVRLLPLPKRPDDRHELVVLSLENPKSRGVGEHPRVAQQLVDLGATPYECVEFLLGDHGVLARLEQDGKEEASSLCRAAGCLSMGPA